MMKRKIFWIQPGLQRRMIIHWASLSFLVTFLTFIITIGWTKYRINPTLAGYISYFVMPALITSAVLGFLISCIAGLLYSHRFAGPVYRFKNTIDETLQGKDPGPIVLRPNDEMKDLADSLNQLLQRFNQASKK